MGICHPQSLNVLEGLIKNFPNLDRARALEAGCGDGRLSKDLLQKWFEKIDMFDQCPEAIRIVKAQKEEAKYIGDVEQASFQKYVCKRHYSAIFMRWVTGYLDDKELVSFLKYLKFYLKEWKPLTFGS